MASGLIPVFKRPVADIKLGKGFALSDSYEELDEIAWEIGCAPFTHMMDVVLDEKRNPWFSSKKGMMTTLALIAYLQHNPGTLKNQNDVLDDLRELKASLSMAAEDEIPFRLAST